MATLHRRTTALSSSRRRLRTTLAAGLLSAAVLAGAPAALAAPADDARVEAARSEHDAVAAEVLALSARVTEAEQRLERMSLEAEAAGGRALEAQAALDVANRQAADAAAALQQAQQSVAEAEDDVASLGRQAYMGGGRESMSDIHLLLDADGPSDLLQQAATLDVLGAERAETLRAFEAVEAQQAQAESQARAAAAEQDRATRAAVEAQRAAEALVTGAQAEFDALAADKARLDGELRAAEIKLLQMQGARDAAVAWEAQQAARLASTAAASAVSVTPGGAVAPATGRVTSCYGQRWGTLHAGVDIAAPIGTPVYAPEGGVVLQAGPASGFGLAVVVQHGDGTITLYGHVNQFFVSEGQVVAAGERIAEVGNRGQSTGPHLHFEVHQGGMYQNRVNPMPWLTSRGISLGGC